MKKILRIIFALNLALLCSFTVFAEEETTTEENTEHVHNIVVDNAVPASCLQTGLTEGSHCEDCGEILIEQEIVPKLEHKRVKIAGKKATCTKSGLTDGVKCEVCETVLVEQKKIDKLGHKTVKIKAVAATCTKTGLTEGKKCKNCGKIIVKQKKTAKISHKYKENVSKYATKSQKGKTSYICKMCGKTKPYSTHNVSSPYKVTLDETWFKVLTPEMSGEGENETYIIDDIHNNNGYISREFKIAVLNNIKYTVVKKFTFYDEIEFRTIDYQGEKRTSSVYELCKTKNCNMIIRKEDKFIEKPLDEKQKMMVYEAFKNAKFIGGYVNGEGKVKKGTNYLERCWKRGGKSSMTILWNEISSLDMGKGIVAISNTETKGKYKGHNRTDIYYVYDENGDLADISDIAKKKDPQWESKLEQGYKEVIHKSTSKYYYTGKEIKPKVKVYDKDGLLIPSKYYTVKYSNNTKIGKGTVNVIMKGKYKGKFKKSFDIMLKSPTKLKVNLKNGGINVSWKKVTGAKKYEVFRSVGGGKYKKITTTTKNSYFENTGVKKDIFYKYYIVAIDKNGNKSEISKEVGVTDYTERYSYVEINDICYMIDKKKNKARTFAWGEVVSKYFGINGQVMDTTVREYFKKYFKDATGWWDTKEVTEEKIKAIAGRVDKTHKFSFEDYIEGYPVYAITGIGTGALPAPAGMIYNFDGLEDVKLPKNLEIINPFVFEGAILKNVKLPDSIKEIGFGALGTIKNGTVYFPKKIKNFQNVVGGTIWAKIIVPGDVNDTHGKIMGYSFY